jgi:DNA-binding beta-propeller fold protein YncE
VTIQVGSSPHDFCHNPVQGRVYVANVNGSSISVLSDSGGGVEESPQFRAARCRPEPTVVRGVLFLPANGDGLRMKGALLDITGRKVMDVHAGANDVSCLAPGVYFVREKPTAASHRLQGIRRVIVTR